MRKIKVIAGIIILLGAIGAFYYVQDFPASVKDSTKEIMNLSLSVEDQGFLNALQDSMKKSSQVMEKMESDLNDAEESDELTDGLEIMEQAKKDILFQWNQVHNTLQSKKTELMKVKQQYEQILMNYREGLNTEIEGMEQGDTQKMKDGYKATNLAKTELAQMVREVNQIIR